jgi:hypothetical protein
VQIISQTIDDAISEEINKRAKLFGFKSPISPEIIFSRHLKILMKYAFIFLDPNILAKTYYVVGGICILDLSELVDSLSYLYAY